jgi:hypothetical protein
MRLRAILGPIFLLVAGLVATSAVWIPGSIAQAQTPSAGSSEGEAPTAQPISLEDVPARAEAARAEIGTLLPREAPRQMLERIGTDVDRTLPEVEALLAKTREALAAEPSIDVLKERAARKRLTNPRLWRGSRRSMIGCCNRRWGTDGWRTIRVRSAGRQQRRSGCSRSGGIAICL